MGGRAMRSLHAIKIIVAAAWPCLSMAAPSGAAETPYQQAVRAAVLACLSSAANSAAGSDLDWEKAIEAISITCMETMKQFATSIHTTDLSEAREVAAYVYGVAVGRRDQAREDLATKKPRKER